MRRTVMTALVAVFLSLAVTGCYTKLKGPEPRTGIEPYSDYYYNYPYGGYYTPFYFQYGWYSPYSFGYPSFYGGFYNPWFYNPYYYDDGYYHDHGGYPPGKEPRTRRGLRSGQELPQVPSGSYVPPSSPSSGQSGQGYQPPPPPPSSGNQGSTSGDDKGNSSDGKATRSRR